MLVTIQGHQVFYSYILTYRTDESKSELTNCTHQQKQLIFKTLLVWTRLELNEMHDQPNFIHGWELLR